MISDNFLRWRGSGRYEQVFLWAVIIVFTAIIIKTEVLARWDFLAYDMQLKMLNEEVPSDIVIIAIDELSLTKLGRWPWSRSTHAKLIRKLTKENVRAIGLDIIFAEPSREHPEGDKALAQSIKDNGNVVLPVLAEQTRIRGQLIETLPIPILAESAAALGHVHVELDRDGIARSVFLLEGLGTPHWQNFAVAILGIAEPELPISLPGIINKQQASESQYAWSRNYKMLIPYAGPPGHFHTVSYANALEGKYAPDTFKNKIVLVGATATGLGDALPTPVSGEAHSMPGVEINAHILQALRNGVNIKIIPDSAQIFISSAFILFLAFLLSHLTPIWNLFITIVMICMALLLSTILLRYFHLWFAPSATLLALIISYPAWSWRRLDNAMNYLKQELAILDAEENNAPKKQNVDLVSVMTFFSEVLPISGWVIINRSGEIYQAYNYHPDTIPEINLPNDQWIKHDNTYWLDVSGNFKWDFLAIQWKNKSAPSPSEWALLEDLLEKHKSLSVSNKMSTVEVVESRILQVKQATYRMRALRQFITDAISQMGNGILIVGPMGDIIIANEKSADYLGRDSIKDLNNTNILLVLESLKVNDSSEWTVLLRKVLLDHEHIHIEAKLEQGKDLLVEIAPLDRMNRELGGMIVNFTDITSLKTSERKRAELLGFLSHDLRSPIVSLMALLEVSKAQEITPSMHSMLDRMESYAQNTLGLADQFLRLAYAEGGENIEYQDCDLTVIALNAIEQIWVQTNKKKITLTYDFQVDEAWIHADPDLIERAINNLLSNAIKYSPSGSKILLSIDLNMNQYSCCITDQGYGIDANEIPHLFKRFYRVNSNNSNNEKGAGLGLAFVKAVAERHNGSIEVSSVIGEGSKFCLMLPH